MASPETKANPENRFLGSTEMLLDAKFRVGIPERFMKVLKTNAPGYPDRVGIIPAADRSLKLLPYPAFLKRIQEWDEMDDQIEAARTVLAFETSLAQEMVLDAQNRIRLTTAQIEFCGLKRDVRIIGRGSFMQVYDPEIFKAMLEQSRNSFAAASDEVVRRRSSGPPAQQFVIEARPAAKS